MSSEVLDDIDEVVVELCLVLIKFHMIFIKCVVNVWNELLKSFWNWTLSNLFLHQFPKFQNIIDICGEDLYGNSASLYVGSDRPPPKYL